MIISFILLPCIIDWLLIWLGEVRWWSVLRCKRSTAVSHGPCFTTGYADNHSDAIPWQFSSKMFPFVSGVVSSLHGPKEKPYILVRPRRMSVVRRQNAGVSHVSQTRGKTNSAFLTKLPFSRLVTRFIYLILTGNGNVNISMTKFKEKLQENCCNGWTEGRCRQ